MSTQFVRGQAWPIGAQMTNASTGADYTGTVTVYVTIDAGIQYLGGTATSEGNGLYNYNATVADTDGDLIQFTFRGTGAVTATIQVPTVTAAQLTALTTATSLPAVSILTIITDAFIELTVYGANEPLSPEDAAFGLGKLNRLFDNWNADRKAVYCSRFSTFAFTPGLNPHTIGPTGTWVVSQRPETIDTLNWINAGVFTEIPVSNDPGWYAGVSMPGMGGIARGGYYEPNWPNGNLYLYPVPQTAYAVELMTRVVIAQVTLTDIFSMPPGYRDAVTLTLAESLAPTYPSAQVSPLLRLAAAKSRARVFANNVPIPRLSTIDSGMPGSRGGYYDFRSGGWK